MKLLPRSPFGVPFLLLVSSLWLLAPPARSIVDTNANGLSDLWEQEFNNGELFDNAFIPQADADGDGWTNAQEAAADTNPFEANLPGGAIRPEIAHVSDVLGDSGESAPVFTISWPTITGKQYTLQWSADLTPEGWTNVEAPFTASGGTVSYTFVQEGVSSLFWRVKVADTDVDGDEFTDWEEVQKGTDPHIADRDDDWLPDEWEIANGLDPNDDGSVNSANGPSGDQDGDGVPNSNELQGNTDPNNAGDFPVQVILITKVADGHSNSVPHPPPNNPYVSVLRWGPLWGSDGASETSVGDSAATPAYLAPILDGIAFPATPPTPVPQTNLALSNSSCRSLVRQNGGGIDTNLTASRVWIKAPPAPTIRKFAFVKVKEVTTCVYETDAESSSFSAEVVNLEIPANETLSNFVDLKPLSSAAEGCDMYAYESLKPVEFELTHVEKERDQDGNELATAVNPGKDALLRDEIADLRIKVPTVNNTDWEMKIDIESTTATTESLGTRGNVQMYDFGTLENGTVTPLTVGANGTTKAGPYDLKLKNSNGGQETIKLVVNKEGTFKIKLKSADNKIDITSQEFTVSKRIRKYGKDIVSTTYDFNKHDRHFENAAEYWGEFYQHNIDKVERLKAIGMTESELGRNPQNAASRPDDIMTIGHPDDHVLDALHFASGFHEKEVYPQSNSIRDLNYPEAIATPAASAIHWGTCWLYHKAQTIASNPQAPPDFIPGPWRTWNDATTRYNGGGVDNYLERVTRALEEGRHPTDNTTLWPLLINKMARQ